METLRNLNNYYARHILSSAVGGRVGQTARLLYKYFDKFEITQFNNLFIQSVIILNNVYPGVTLLDRVDVQCDIEIAEWFKQYVPYAKCR